MTYWDGNEQADGHPTRGKTARNRLRRIDLYLALMERELLQRTDGDYRHALYVDLGYGRLPFTTLESAERLRRVNPDLRVLGVEIEPERVEQAQPYADEQTMFREGGFHLPLQTAGGRRETVRLIRAMNVLRQYEEEEVREAYRTLGRLLLPGGLLVEGTSNPSGRVWVVNLLRRQEGPAFHLEAILFGTNFKDGFDPAMFQPVLPKLFIHRMVAGEWMHTFFEAWKAAWLETMSLRVFGPRQWFLAAAGKLQEAGYPVDLHSKLISRGMLKVNSSADVPPIDLDLL